MVSLGSQWWHAIGLVLIVVLCVEKSSAQFITVNCYECTNCTDPFSSSGVTVKSACNSCYKLAMDVAYAPYRYVVRRCVPACLETSQTFGGGTLQTTCCATNYCNAGSMIKLSTVSRLLLVLFTVFNLLRRIY